MIVQDKIAQALTWIEFENNFAGYMEALEHVNAEEAYRAYLLCGDAYIELCSVSDEIIKLAKHLQSL